MANKESDAQDYLKKHQIMELFENLTAQLIYERPGEYLNEAGIDVSLSLGSFRSNQKPPNKSSCKICVWILFCFILFALFSGSKGVHETVLSEIKRCKDSAEKLPLYIWRQQYTVVVWNARCNRKGIHNVRTVQTRWFPHLFLFSTNLCN